ncbi:adhesion G-protein coupled receptor G2 [Thalassophryne amazonica]|uniref:adhesion G-protein coupled receptor G2 n=1 Tax=Thalassophryne amazonica TaxID=390379 RepID=UPI001470A104|nr:adhesion G-protein coupled receptor G2 [Thalassophryne amazonica]
MVEPDGVCMVVAAALHYFLLCTFTWMAIEGLHLYLLLIKVFNTYYKHYIVKLSAAGWGIPGLIVGVSLAMKDYKQLYGITVVTMGDSNTTKSICWITDNTFFYSLNLVYVTVIIIFNTAILLTVSSHICQMKRVLRTNKNVGTKVGESSQWDPVRFNESCKSSITVMSLTCLLGTSWGLAFLGLGYVNYTVLYLFCILNSTQGFFIFLWICLSTKKEWKREDETKITSTPMKSSGLKSD